MLKIMTLNINYYVDKHGAWEARRNLIASAIRRVAPDIICLQAVQKDPDLDGGINQACQIANLINYPHVVFQPAVEYDTGLAQGSAIIAKLPFADTDFNQLTLREGLEDTNHRIVLYARFELPDQPLHLFNAHFSWVPEQTQDNVAEALVYIAETSALQDHNILLGDMNATADTKAMQYLAKAGWIDAWQRMHSTQTGYTFEADHPSIRIDYIWLDQQLNSHMSAMHIVTAHSDGRARLSDHFGLLVELDVRV